MLLNKGKIILFAISLLGKKFYKEIIMQLTLPLDKLHELEN